jgi:RNA polymerase sigma-70 factor (ECF subfamily)
MAASLVRLLGRPRIVVPPLPVADASDEWLMERVRQGDTTHFATIFERYREPVWRFFRRRVAEPSRAEELAQQTFVAALASAARYEARGAFRSYLFGIAFNLLMEWRRQSRQFELLEVADTPASGGDPDAALWVKGALAQLEPEQREILMLREYEELSYQEIADVLALPLNTVRTRLFRAREAMRVALHRRVRNEENHGDR